MIICHGCRVLPAWRHDRPELLPEGLQLLLLCLCDASGLCLSIAKASGEVAGGGRVRPDADRAVDSARALRHAAVGRRMKAVIATASAGVEDGEEQAEDQGQTRLLPEPPVFLGLRHGFYSL